jgi:hypothetical protein
MPIRSTVIQNNSVVVAYVNTPAAVTVLCQKTMQTKLFAGWDGLPGLFESFAGSMSDNTSYEDAITFFKPNIGDVVITNLNDKK